MPILDMPLEELRRYRGLNPKPQDFDAYWERGLAEMAATDARVELRPAGLKTGFAECHDLYFTGVRGARVYAKFIKPKNASRAVNGKSPAVLIFHGYTGSSGDWLDKLPWAAEGFYVAALDCRGQGGLSEDVGGVRGTTFRGHIIRGLAGEPDDMLMRHVFLDTAQLARIVMGMPGVDASRVYAQGGSQGGGLTLACASLEPRVSRLFAVYPFLSDYRRVWEMDLAKGAYEEIATFFRQFDPLHEKEGLYFDRLGYIDVHNLAPRIQGETRMACGLQDNICPPSTQFAAYNNIAAKKEALIYPDYGHEGIPGVSDLVFEFFARG